MNELPPIRSLLSALTDDDIARTDDLASCAGDRRGAAYDRPSISGCPTDNPLPLQYSNAGLRNRIVRTEDGAESRRTVPSGLASLQDVRVVIVDDCALHRECLVGVLAARPGVVGVGVAWDLKSLVAEVHTTLPHVVVLSMSTRDSAMLLRHASRLGPDVRVVVVGVSEEDESGIVACAEGGASGYHLRTESLDNLVVLIHEVAAGESSCSPGVSAILLRRLSTLASQRRRPAARELPLTAREIQILHMLEAGLANRDIAGRLCIAVHTVKNHVHSVLTKLGVSSREEAAALARNIFAADDVASY